METARTKKRSGFQETVAKSRESNKIPHPKKTKHACIVKWWADSMECYCYLQNVKDVLADGKTPHERRFGEPLKGPIIPFGALPSSARDQARLHHFGKKVLPVIFLGYGLIAGRIWKGDILIAVIEELENLEASEVYPERLNAKEVLLTQRKGELVLLVADSTAKLSGRDHEFQEPTPRREQTVRRKSFSGESQGEAEESQPTESRDDVEARRDF